MLAQDFFSYAKVSKNAKYVRLNFELMMHKTCGILPFDVALQPQKAQSLEFGYFTHCKHQSNMKQASTEYIYMYILCSQCGIRDVSTIKSA